jgi:very-short-patch-repair endonuclease
MVVQRNSGEGVWRAVGRLAERQHGVVSRNQLRRLGMSETAIDHAVVTGRLYPNFRAVFGVGHERTGKQARMLAAVLACGEGSVVSHGTAAALLGLWEHQPDRVDVIAPIQAGRKIDGICRRHVPWPLPGDTWAHEAVPCTSPSRTIVDVAGIVGEELLSRTVEQAAVLGVLHVARIDAILAGPRRRGSPRLRGILEHWRRYSPDTRLRSRMEAKLLPLLSKHNIPIPEINQVLVFDGEPFEIDFLWRAQRLALETDGNRFHGNPLAQARDRHRDCVLAAAGYRVPRLGWDDLRDRPEVTIAEIARLLHLPSSTVL